MKRFLRVLAFVTIATALLTLTGLPWVLLAGAELYWAPAIGAIALALAK